MFGAAVAGAKQSDSSWIAQGWQWLGKNDAQVQALAALAVLVVTVMIWLVYRKQADTMWRQAQIMESQTAIATRQASLQDLILTIDHAPHIVPTYSAAIPCYQNGSFQMKNLGSGPAFDLSVFTWFVRPGSGTRRRANEFRAAKQYLLPGEQTDFAPVHPPTWDQSQDREELAVLFHYTDVFGHPWHTTWNIHPTPRLGEGTQGAPMIWNPANWREHAAILEQYCGHCLGKQS